MKNLRRILAVLLVRSAPLVLFSSAKTSEQAAASRRYLAYVGTYTTKTESKGIYTYEFDADTGKLPTKGVAAETRDPSWVAVHPRGKYLYAANEAGKTSTVSAFAVDVKSGKLTLLNQIASLGEDPCYLSFDKTGKYVLVANYSSGTVGVFPILADGRLGEHTAMVKDQGATGPNKERQESPHAHWIETTTGNRLIYVADLGLDRVLIYDFDAATGTLTPSEPLPPNGIPTKRAHQPLSATVSPGAGPRHVAFSPAGSIIYVLSELQSTVTVFVLEALHGFFNAQQISTLPKGYSGRNDAAEIAFHPNGKFLYTSNRGHESIAVFAVDPSNGTLTSVAHVPTGGEEPRPFAIVPHGQHMLS